MSDHDEWHYHIKIAFQQLVKAVGIGSLEAAGAISGVAPQTIHKYCTISPDTDGLPPLRVVMALEAACGRPIVTTVMARRTGHQLIDTGEAAAQQCMTEAHAKLSRVHGELQSAYLVAQADGLLSANEIKQVTGLYSQIATILGDIQGAAASRLHVIEGGRRAS